MPMLCDDAHQDIHAVFAIHTLEDIGGSTKSAHDTV